MHMSHLHAFAHVPAWSGRPSTTLAKPALKLRGGASLTEYERFHGMLVGPGSAQRCIESFNGRILFMPSSYSRDADSFPAKGRSPWEPSTLNLFTYYLLVLFSLTGLSTLLGQTSVLDARALSSDSDSDGLERQRQLCSAETPRLVVDQIALDYLVAPGSSRPLAHAVQLKRRFEYNFKLAGVRVVMLHFISLGPDGTPVFDAAGNEILHLVEVYETPWSQGHWNKWNKWMVNPVALGVGGLGLLAAVATKLIGT